MNTYKKRHRVHLAILLHKGTPLHSRLKSKENQT